MGKNRKRYPGGIALAVLALVLGGCFSPLKEAPMGYIQIGAAIHTNGGAASDRTVLPGADELAVMTYKVHLSGPGGTIDQNLGPSGGTISLIPGNWKITVKAYIDASTDESRLRGIAEETIIVTPGGSHTITLKPCIGVSTEADLKAIFDSSSQLSLRYPPDTAKGDLIVLESDITASMAATGILQVPSGRDVTIIAEPGTTRTLTTASFAVNLGSLTLGKAGETGKLVFDGAGLDYFGGSYSSWPLYVYSSGSLTINGNTEIKNFVASNGQGGAIMVQNGSTLTINGGDIHHNQNTESTGFSFGGAIFVQDSTFVMNGGIIRNNSAIDSGGGVYIVRDGTSPASFTMYGGTIRNNTADNSGGGVYVSASASSATFTMYDGTIDNNTAGAQGGGVWHDGEFTMNGGTISNNKVASSTSSIAGGGIYQQFNSSNSNRFTMNGGRVTGNSALCTLSSGGAAQGGGIMGGLTSSNMDLNGGTISNNTASSTSGTAYGGGIHCDAIVTLANTNTIGAVVIRGNSAGTGGGVYSSTPNLNFNGTTISGNNATDSTGIGGAYKNGGFTSGDFVNVTISGNMRNGAVGPGYDYN
ncbi:hypothetical protein AGMMS49928_10450 [Spirochaetia bacterium]|nr:hypothetical protein AGMMS49928_10450 [Spirochaetia bacterium]